MDVQDLESGPPSKRRKVASMGLGSGLGSEVSSPGNSPQQMENNRSLDRPISPPPPRSRRSRTPAVETPRVEQQLHHKVQKECQVREEHVSEDEIQGTGSATTKIIPSPFQLTKIRDLGPQCNAHTVTLKDILCDPMIKECWNFNYLFDLDFVMDKFDPDVRDLVKVKIIHGFWRKDDPKREALHGAAECYPNIQLINAYIPDPFGTHHSKMLILFRHDDLAQVIIHTANMIPRDWTNMTQAVWSSPLLPCQIEPEIAMASDANGGAQAHMIGSGERFKIDLLRYLDAYGKRLTDLTKELLNCDFTPIQAAFLGSTPSRQKPRDTKSETYTGWGWLGLQEILSSIPIRTMEDPTTAPHVVVQVSSIATLGQTSTWLKHFQSVLGSQGSQIFQVSKAARRSDEASLLKTSVLTLKQPKPKLPGVKFSIIFPTPHEIRCSLDGYASGGSIHTKIQSAAQQKQLEYLRPFLCHWRYYDDEDDESKNARKAERGPAAPHIKTYVRFSDQTQRSIDWAMVTSANLSKQAWGDVQNKNQEIWIQSWECGVVVWPALLASTKTPGVFNFDVEMVPVFGKDIPEIKELAKDSGETEGEHSGMDMGNERTIVGFRMPYDLPLEPYRADEVPWCATSKYDEPDWMGRIWEGY